MWDLLLGWLIKIGQEAISAAMESVTRMGRRVWAEKVPLLLKSVVHFQTFGQVLANTISVNLLKSDCL